MTKFVLLLLSLLLCFSISITQCAVTAPVITGISPPVFLNVARPVTIKGKNFGTTFPTVYVNNVVLQTISSTDTELKVSLDYINLQYPTNGIYSFKVVSSNIESNTIIVNGFNLPTVTQKNDKVYLTTQGSGTFSQCSPDLLTIGSVGSTVPVTLVNDNTIFFQLTYQIAKNAAITYQSNGIEIGSTGYTYGPVASVVQWVGTQFQITGFSYVAPITVYLNGYNTTIASLTNTVILVDPVKQFFEYNSSTINPSVQIEMGNRVTYINDAMVSLTSFTSVDVTLSRINLFNSNADANGLPVLIGLTNAPISLINSNSTAVGFNMPYDAQCGYAYLSKSTLAVASSTLFLCPSPKLLSISKYSKLTGKITITGNFLNRYIYGTSDAAVNFNFYFSNGTQSPCNSPDIIYSGTTYTLTCSVPEITNGGKFNVQTKSGSSDSIAFEAPKPITISAVTPIAYGSAGTVTILGTNFLSSSLTVKIGGILCEKVMVNIGGTLITCIFTGDVKTADPKINVLNVTIITAEDSLTAPVFSYTCTANCGSHGTCIYIHNGCQCDSVWVGTECNKLEPTITSITSTKYGEPGRVTILGTNFVDLNIKVTIGGSSCTDVILLTKDLKQLSCLFQSDVKIDDDKALDVVVTIDSTFSASNSIFYYTKVCPNGVNGQMCSGRGTCNPNIQCACEAGWYGDVCATANPEIKAVSSIKYGTPDKVTITGSGFVNYNLQVKIGGSVCTDPQVSLDLSTIVCLFQSNIPISNDGDLLEVYVGIDNQFIKTANVFTYTKQCLLDNVVCYGRGTCNQQTYTCDCDKGWSASNCSVIYPKITSITSTKQGTPGQVTIVGNNFINLNLFVSIGGSQCTNPTVSQDLTSIVCLYQSDVPMKNNNINEAIQVYVSINSTFTTSNDVFIYTKPEQKCPVGSNGQVCSSHGQCNQQFLCDCDKDWESSDCSIQDITNELGVVLEEPVVKENNTESIIKTPSGVSYDVGIEMVNELNINNEIILSYSLKNMVWSTPSDKQHYYSATLENGATIIVQLTINSENQRVYYNFAGDNIPILPKSIKYQIELHNWTFSSSFNSAEFIFKSGLTSSGESTSTVNKCGQQQETTTSTKSSDNSIRSIQISLNGETLIGTFSDRMILDSRPSYNRVSQLSIEQIKKYQLPDTTTVYTSIQTSSFKNSVVVDPNFGVLVSSKPEECSSTSSGIANWKLAVIIVCSVVGASIIVTATWLFLKKNSRAKILILKMRTLKG